MLIVSLCMSKWISFLIALCCCTPLAFAQVGKMFPALSGTTLDNRNVSLPSSTKGKFVVLGIAYSQKSEDELKTWLQPAFSAFINEPEYEVQTYFTVMIGGVKQAAGGSIEKKMKAELDPELHKNVLVYQGALGNYKDELNMTAKDVPYFFVLDATGKIVYATSGAYSKGKMDGMTKLLPAKEGGKDDDDDDEEE